MALVHVFFFFFLHEMEVVFVWVKSVESVERQLYVVLRVW